mmetsp:Transcript_8514/g.17320  ORF Transcript_8514/g.17320 Transcript_8514/m.17320 type:complete len:84 (-) Transcript_8514:127-378(-)
MGSEVHTCRRRRRDPFHEGRWHGDCQWDGRHSGPRRGGTEYRRRSEEGHEVMSGGLRWKFLTGAIVGWRVRSYSGGSTEQDDR